MASIVPTEGLDYLVGLITGDTASAPSSLWLGLFTSQTSTTVPAANTVLANAPTGVTEAAFTSYLRVEVPSSDWGTIGADTIGTLTARAATAAQKSFAAAGAASSTAINGFFLATASSDGVALLYSNFDEGAVASLALGDIIRVTPTFGLGDIAGVA